ncbi:PREDICTED: probable transcription factor At5g28040 [Nelumbo nucifera]|uniref:Probable transcription factor At5g28040 n=1 Tax=Nelumbo nucifera TaxID=4432 RepID=A0A1U7YUY1_NELNU|nr:PREDICTED: probable transcription factor At5g28040 [Nelumbo nucifera]
MSSPSETPTSKRKKHSPSKDPAEKRRKSSSKPSGIASPEERKSIPFKRVFSEEDEIQLLKAFLEISKTAKASESPASVATILFDRVKDSLSSEFSRTQLIDKLRKLRLKYSKQVENMSFIKTPHERDLFEISHRIWGEEPEKEQEHAEYSAEGEEEDKEEEEEEDKEEEEEEEELPREVTRKEKAKSKTLKKGKEKPKRKVLTTPIENGEAVVAEEPAEKGLTVGNDEQTKNGETVQDTKVSLRKFPYVVEEMLRLPGNAMVREGLRCVDASLVKRMNEEWRLQQIAEAEVLAKRAELIRLHSKRILEAIVSSSPE